MVGHCESGRNPLALLSVKLEERGPAQAALKLEERELSTHCKGPFDRKINWFGIRQVDSEEQ